MAEGGLHRNFMENLLKTGITGSSWPKKTYLFVVVIENVNEEVVWKKEYQTNENHVHTEIQMLKDTAFQHKVGKRQVDIILTSNYSPCGECAAELTKFYEKKKSSIGEFIIQFSHPYRTNKESNQDGLKRLKSAGIILDAMTMESWFHVMTRFVSALDPDKILERDQKTREELDKLLGENSESESTDLESESSDSNVGRLTDKMKKFDI